MYRFFCFLKKKIIESQRERFDARNCVCVCVCVCVAVELSTPGMHEAHISRLYGESVIHAMNISASALKAAGGRPAGWGPEGPSQTASWRIEGGTSG